MKTKNIIIIVLLLIVGLFCLLLASWTSDPDTKNISLNIFSSATVVFIIELIVLVRDSWRYSFLQGTYKRTQIFGTDPEKKTDTKYVDMTKTYNDNIVNQEIVLHYDGDAKYHGYAHYDKGKKGKTKITLNLDTENPMTGTGTYQYLEKTVIDIGTYKFQVDIDKKRIYIFYSNLLPSGLASGYEIWKK
jgi:hypothetical protein